MADNTSLSTLEHLKLLALRCSSSCNAKILDLTNAISETIAELEEAKQDKLAFDTKPTPGSVNPVTSDGVYQAIGDIDTILDAINGEVI